MAEHQGRPKTAAVHVRRKTNTNGEPVFQFYFYGPDVDGKRKEHARSGFPSADQALEAGLAAYRAFMQTGSYSVEDKGAISLSDFVFTIWFPQKIQTKQWQSNTIKGYTKKLEATLIPALGSKPIAAITSAEIQQLLNNLFYRDHRTVNSVSNLHSLLVNIFNFAVALKYIESSPMLLVATPHCDIEEDDFEFGEQTRDIIPETILDKIFERFPVGSSPRVPMLISLFTGMRLGEVFGLTWDDIDFEREIVHIRRQMQCVNGVHFLCNPKYNSKRSVPLCAQLKDVLLEEKKRQDDAHTIFRYYISKAPDGDTRNTHGVFNIYIDDGEGCKEIFFLNVSPNGGLITPDVMKHTSRVIHGYSCDHRKKKPEAPIYSEFNFHSLRHTFCSQLFIQGVNSNYIGAMLGHKHKQGMSRTTARYTHIPFEILENEKDKINNVYSLKYPVQNG